MIGGGGTLLPVSAEPQPCPRQAGNGVGKWGVDMPHKSTEAGHPPGMAEDSARIVEVMEGAVELM